MAIEKLKELISSAMQSGAQEKREVAQLIVWDDETKPIDPEDLEIALDFLKDAIEANDHEAMNTLGAMYYKGRGLDQDFKKSVEWYKKAASFGNVYSMSNLGYCYLYGRHVEVDYEKAYYYFSKSALLGDLVSTYKVADMMIEGQYVEKDVKSAVEIYIHVYNRLAGQILSLDDEEVYANITLRLGRILYEGVHIEKALVESKHFLSEARIFFNLLKDRGNESAEPKLKEVEELLRKIDVESMN